MVISIVAAVVAALAAVQQQPPTDKPAPDQDKKHKNVVVVSGCVSGSMLTNAKPREYVLMVPETLRTTGSRAMRAQLKEVDGHTVELTGTLKGLKNATQGALVKDTGKTKIYVGGTERRAGNDAMFQEQVGLPTLDVSSLTDIAPHCLDEKSP